MSEASKAARKAMHEKIARLTADPHEKVDASSWMPPEPLNADVQTGERPISPRQYKRGGKVEGEFAKIRADHKRRKSGGRTLTANSLINRDVKEANEERDGTKHVGGFKRGGSPKHDDTAQDMKLVRKMVEKKAIKPSERAKGGRLARADGGPVGYHIIDRHTGSVVGKATSRVGATRSVDRRDKAYGGYRYRHEAIYPDHPAAASFAPKASAQPDPIARKSGGRTGKGKMNVNIVIAAGGRSPADMQQAPGGAMAPPHPQGVPVPAPPPQGAATPMPVPVQMPPGAPPPGMMPRKSGGRTMKVAHDMAEHGGGGGSGLGRLEKIRAYGDQR